MMLILRGYIVRMVMIPVVFMVMCGSTVIATEPKGCRIYHLNATHSGESWTPTVPIKSLVNVALRNPNPDPWQEVNLEFESDTGANVGTLLMQRQESKVTLTLKTWATTVHSRRDMSQVHDVHQLVDRLLHLQDWVYVNVSVARKVKLAIGDSDVSFGHLTPRNFKSLYVRVPDGEELEVGFNCNGDNAVAAKAVDSTAAPDPEAPENSGKMVIIVAAVLLVLLVGVVAFWCLGRKKRNALREDIKDDGNESVDKVYWNEDDEENTKMLLKERRELNDSGAVLDDTCDDCGDVINEESEGETSSHEQVMMISNYPEEMLNDQEVEMVCNQEEVEISHDQEEMSRDQKVVIPHEIEVEVLRDPEEMPHDPEVVETSHDPEVKTSHDHEEMSNGSEEMSNGSEEMSNDEEVMPRNPEWVYSNPDVDISRDPEVELPNGPEVITDTHMKNDHENENDQDNDQYCSCSEDERVDKG